MMRGMASVGEAGAAVHVERLGRQPALDGLRGVAVLVVVAYHAFPKWLPGGGLGVDLFFVLSGFLITRLLVEEREHTGRVRLGSFYRRRACRLLPAFAVFLVVTAGWFWLTDPWLFRAHMAWLPFAYGTNAMISQGWGTVWFGHIWSLAAEEQFYLLWPPLVVVLLRRSPRHVAVVAGVLAAGSAVAMIWLYATGASGERIYYGPDTHAAPLLIGSLCGALWPRARCSWPALAVLAGFFTLDEMQLTLFRGGYVVLAVAAAVVVLHASRGGFRWLAHPALRRAGFLSYAAYLWHPFLLEVAGPSPAARLVAVAATWPVAVVSMAFVERPALRLAVEPR